jgi:signal recognition particle subunit SRP72
MTDCLNSYEKLQKYKIDSVDLNVNTIAALVAAGRASEVHAAMKAQKVDLTTRALRDARSFELAYNSACTLIENKKYSEAKEQLDLAKR